ncbi:hypothetical protein ACFE04_011351 [Oxalis oulophora]
MSWQEGRRDDVMISRRMSWHKAQGMSGWRQAIHSMSTDSVTRDVERTRDQAKHGAEAENCPRALASPKPMKPEPTALGPTGPKSEDAETRNAQVGGNCSHAVNQGCRTGPRQWRTGANRRRVINQACSLSWHHNWWWNPITAGNDVAAKLRRRRGRTATTSKNNKDVY